MKKNRPKCIGFHPGYFTVYIEFITPKGNKYTGVYSRKYYTNNEVEQAIKEALLQPDIIASYCSQDLIPIY